MHADPQLFVLPNGLTLLVDERPHLSSVSISVAVRVGSADEAPNEAGLTHLLEHMLFRGSAQHPTTEALMAPFEDGGGMLEAETWRDHTHFFAEVHKSALTPAMLALGDMVTRPTFGGLSAERRLVEAELLGELDENGDDADLHTMTRYAVWGAGPMSRRVVGTEATVRKFGVAALRRHHRAHYVGRRMVLAVCGPVRAQPLLATVQRAFGDLPAGSAAATGPTPTFAPLRPATFVASAGSQVHLQLSFPAFGLRDPRHHDQLLVAAVLGEGMLCRLQRALSEKTGLVYAYEAGLDVYEGCGTYDIELQVAPMRAARAVSATCAALTELATFGVTGAEFARVQTRHRIAQELARDRPSERSYEMALAALFARASVVGAGASAERLNEAAASLFLQPARHLLAMGPLTPALKQAIARAWVRGDPSPPDGPPAQQALRVRRPRADAPRRLAALPVVAPMLPVCGAQQR